MEQVRASSGVLWGTDADPARKWTAMGDLAKVGGLTGGSSSSSSSSRVGRASRAALGPRGRFAGGSLGLAMGLEAFVHPPLAASLWCALSIIEVVAPTTYDVRYYLLMFGG